MAANLIQPHEFNVNAVSISPLKSGGSTFAKMAYLSHKNDRIMIQTPSMFVPFDIIGFTQENKDNVNNGPPKYTLNLSFKDKENDENTAIFFDKISELDELVKTRGAEMYVEANKKKIKPEFAVEFYKSSIRYSQDPRYAPTFRANIPFVEGKFNGLIYDHNKNLVDDINQINIKYATVTAIIQCTGMWVTNVGYGLGWKVCQMRVHAQNNLRQYAFKDEYINEKKTITDEEEENDVDYE